MTTRGRALRFTAVSALVVLSLTGFSTGRGHGHGGGDGGGGCSSSSQDHDSSSSTTSGGGAHKDDDTDDDSGYGGATTGGYGSGYDTDDDGGGSGGGDADTGGPEPATVELVSCATESDPYATVEITNPNAREYTFAVTVYFKDGEDFAIDDAREEATVPARGVSQVRLRLVTDTLPDHCELYDPEPLPLT
ncbi:hypothetical protein [Streptomyces lancefieldiae]|uniref:Secreted protein n=1 Tax=Streptomyces lancefieldiae TaxID=3075520 RepID=A0ABU3AZR0_9ACTN|nr:hypothetical protein [Streptomyces sp. DSM 40712]MDT0614281.1 hypothetical protein [Streptomyces sp. DSM 40712]